MARRFPEPAAHDTPISSPSCSILGSTKALFIWPTGKDTLQYYVTGDASTAVQTRTATTGTSFNATEGQIETTTSSGVDAIFSMPHDLLGTDWVNGGPFTVFYLHYSDCSNGGPSGANDFFRSLNGSGYGSKLEVASGGGWQYKNYSSSPSWAIDGPGQYILTAGEKWMVYRHQSGDQDYWTNSTAESSRTTSTTGGAVLGTSTYPLQVGATFHVANDRRSYFKGCIIVPSAVSDGDIASIVGAAGQIVTAAGGSTYTPRSMLLGAG